VRIGDVIIGNICGTGVDVIATADNWMGSKEHREQA